MYRSDLRRHLIVGGGLLLALYAGLAAGRSLDWEIVERPARDCSLSSARPSTGRAPASSSVISVHPRILARPNSPHRRSASVASTMEPPFDS